MTEDDKRNARGAPDDATLAAIRALCDAANREVFLRDYSPHPHEESNAEVQAARTKIASQARKLIPTLLAALDAVRAENESLKKDGWGWFDCCQRVDNWLLDHGADLTPTTDNPGDTTIAALEAMAERERALREALAALIAACRAQGGRLR